MYKRTEIEYIRQFLGENGYKLLTENYRNQKQKLETECPNGHKYNITFNNFKRGDRCNVCTGKNQKFTLEEVQRWFKEWNCTLITEDYRNQRQLLEYNCKCGEPLSNTFQRLRHFCKDPFCNACRKQSAKEQRRADAEEIMSKIWF
ncbi:hypothetical protein BRE01_64310 [Brevibacillus reuszeri]|uniref:Zinc-ribbon domain-containing protein n=1 Tax=Brevibacillus reuszeri TaxID=54915 RepID=A0A0K9YXE7_9BACL|nr:hypothetical protein [Brevibacillus reuszeri]KNB72915.1 hypothetical protein ADS79_13885 [Brevibacillus reuszeri]MED1861719.1 hypothetical protein [Brevibacillus reuszeri]GED72729.1 hypothetical protein BRE01_64310 [Brevibacillus reuszeri]